MLSLKTYRTRPKGLPDLLPYAALIEPDVILCKDGSLLACWEVRGADTESGTDEELAFISDQVNRAMCCLGSGWMLHMDAVRLPATAYPPREASHFPDPVSAMLDEARRKTFESGRYFTTSTVLTVCRKPASLDATLRKLTRNAVTNEANLLEQSLAEFQRTLGLFEDAIGDALFLDRLGSGPADSPVQFSPLLSFLQLCLTGDDYLPRLPVTPMYLDALLGGQDLIGGLTPRIGARHIAVIALDGLPSESRAAMLALLSSLPFACRFSTRFICLDKAEALKEVDRYRKTWAQNIYRFFDKVFNKANRTVNEDAAEMAADAAAAYKHLQEDFFGAGFYTANMVLLDEDQALLQENIRTVRRLLINLGFGCRLEEVNALEAWLSTHPGNWYANVRRPLINTLNLADFLPLTSTWPGEEFAPCPFYPAKSPALLQCATENSTPFRFNLHWGDLGHTLIFGPTGAGKSTLLALIAAQFRRYENSTVFVFDKGMSIYPLCKAVGGQHYDVGGDVSPSFCPLGLLDSEEEMAWAEEWIGTLASLRMNAPILPGHGKAVHEAMQQLRGAPQSMRTLSNFITVVPRDDLKEALLHYTLSGAMGHLLDAGVDGLSQRRFTVFEIERLMEMKEVNCLPVLLYLFRHIQRNLKGQPTLIILDEAWLMLGHPVFAEKIREWLKVMRKANCAVVLATQSLSDARNSNIFLELLQSCPTKIYLPNHEARESTSRPFYESMGLNPRQIELIAQARRKREYYVVQPSGRRLVNLALTPLELAFVGSSSKDDIARIQELESQHGPAWVEAWLREKGVAA